MTLGLQLSRVTARLGGHIVLNDVSLSVAPGELVSLQGPSGAGKTSLLRAAAGLIPATGDIRPAPLRGTRPAMIFQQHALAGRLSVLDNVLVGALSRVSLARAAIRRFPAAEIGHAQSCLARVQLHGFGSRRADTLSGGQRQRVSIARALAQNATVLLADEPVASLDPDNADHIMALLQSLARVEGLAVLVSLHQPELARRYADRSLRLRNGKLEPEDMTVDTHR